MHYIISIEQLLTKNDLLLSYNENNDESAKPRMKVMILEMFFLKRERVREERVREGLNQRQRHDHLGRQ